MSELQPIETAPKDGTPIYVYLPNWDGRGPLVRTAWVGRPDYGFWMNSFLNGSTTNPAGFKPLWWMPLPGPPQSPAKEA